MGIPNQAGHGVRFEWGLNGVTEVANAGGVTIIVDVASARARIATSVAGCASGLDLNGRGFPADVEVATELDASHCVPRLPGQSFAQAQD